MSDIPRIRTERALVTLLQPEQAPLLQTYCIENREHLGRWERIRDEAFYTVDDVEVPQGFSPLFQEIPESRFRKDISSTALRGEC